mmetsp:Transcript_116660/g.363284  ORF Transcript_116660/g.363284 Transcript_116660/m.363284 type:complete len:131 (-) Transcript_116660:129-521(-)
MATRHSLEEAELPVEGPAAAASLGASLLPAFEVCHADDAAPLMLHCLFAMLATAASMHLLTSAGLVSRASCSCGGGACDGGYSWCQVLQDARSLVFMCLGTVLCLQYKVGGGTRSTEEGEKGGFYAFLLW